MSEETYFFGEILLKKIEKLTEDSPLEIHAKDIEGGDIGGKVEKYAEKSIEKKEEKLEKYAEKRAEIIY